VADENAIELIKRGDARFGKRQTLDSYRQEVALMFAPQHAAWTTDLNLGEDFAAHLMDGTPLIVAEDYVSMIGSMLRPAGRQWFWHRTPYEDMNAEPEIRDYLDWRSQQLMRFMFERTSGAEGALAEADVFYGLFGDAVIAIDYATPERKRLTVQHYHSKDATWEIGKDNKPDVLTRKETLPARVIKARFSTAIDKPLHQDITKACDENPSKTFDIRHEVLPAEEYDAYIKKSKSSWRDGQWASVWIDATNKQVLRETYVDSFRYVIPRAGRRYGYPYGISRATMIALPDARLIQQQATAILEAAEKQVDPPVMAFGDVLRGAPELRSRAINMIEADFANSKHPPIMPLELAKNFRLGVDSLMRTEAQIARAFRLDRIRFPDTRNSKTVEEAQFLINEFVRSAVPMFSPMKSEYSDEVLYEADRLVEAAGGYSGREKPEALRELPADEMVFSWENALTDMLERQKVQRITEVSQIGQTVAAYDAAAQQVQALQQVDSETMLRDGVVAVGGSSWIMAAQRLKEKKAAIAQQNAQQQMIAAAPNIAQLVDSGVNAAEVANDIPLMAEPGLPLLPAPA
jgi:hypothetical protein